MTPFIVILVFCLQLTEICGHGMMLEPPNRSSLWRFDSRAPVNYNDNANFCGGLSVQWNTFGGKCGVCGDRYDEPHPQANENTGTYGTGKVVRTYKSGSLVTVSVNLTTNHLGNFKYSLCVLSDTNAPELGEDCFKPIKIGDGSDHYNVAKGVKYFMHQLQLPNKLTCHRCVLRWHYKAGNNWGQCDNGTFAEGCGPQETFRSCADVTIV